jgi:hypothetical protein
MTRAFYMGCNPSQPDSDQDKSGPGSKAALEVHARVGRRLSEPATCEHIKSFY